MRKLAVAVAVAVMFVVQPSAWAGADFDLTITDFQFNPPSQATTALGQTVRWTNSGPSTHTSTSDGYNGTKGPKLWKSLDLAPATNTGEIVFASAGTFKYHCSIHSSMRGRIIVPVFAPANGTKGVPFTVEWAATAIPDGFNVDVQVKRPGQPFRNWKPNRRGGSVQGNFTPGKIGTYKFRARLQNDATNGVSGYSPLAVVQVT